MNQQPSLKRNFTRRSFFKVLGGAALLTAGAAAMPRFLRRTLLPEGLASADEPYDLYYAGTDGWMSLPGNPINLPGSEIGYFFPDDLAPGAPDGYPDGLNTYIFGFRNISGMSAEQKAYQRMRAQHSAPLFWVDQGDDFRLRLTNLGLAMRPDLTDAHTLHWHGFRNVIPFFDGEPTGSVGVPVDREFTYVFRPHEEGTYMFHCHVEDVEHVHMGMTGLVFVHPSQNGTPYPISRPAGSTLPTTVDKFAYNDGDGSTGYDRQFAMFLSEVWAEAHWCDSHIQLPDWSDYRADFSLLNGRAFPDTLAPNAAIDASDTNQQSLDGGFNAIPYARTADGDLVGVGGRDDLRYQPMSSLVTCNAGERVLLRFANLGFREAAMTLAGIPMKVVGRDATIMRGRPNQSNVRIDTSYETDTISIGAGESYDVIFTAPAHSGGTGPDKYVLYNRRLTQVENLAAGGFGGQRTEIHVYPSGVTAQQFPNDWGI